MKKVYLIGIIAVLLLIGLASRVISVSAQSPVPVSGYAWSSTIGWVSLSSATDGSAVSYGVTSDASGNLSGQAWSPNVGWIKFGGLDPDLMPQAGVGTYQNNAKINDNNSPSDSTDDYLEGWAIVCSIYASGCSGSLAVSSVTGGWDGWISLSGRDQSNANTYKANINEDQLETAQSWGSEIVGWLGFNIIVPDEGLPVECNDGVNNDSEDNSADWPADIGCDYPEDPDESNQCSDGIDNDNNDNPYGLIDADDPGCHVYNTPESDYNPADNTEYNEAVPPGVDLKVGIIRGGVPQTPIHDGLTIGSGLGRDFNLKWTIDGTASSINCNASASPEIPDPVTGWSGSKAAESENVQALLRLPSNGTYTLVLRCFTDVGQETSDKLIIKVTGQEEI